MTIKEVGSEYLDALATAQEALIALETNDGDSYDPCDYTKKRVKAEFDAAVLRLANATKALIELA